MSDQIPDCVGVIVPQVTLTLMGDSTTIPWRLLDIDILVEDHETGSKLSLYFVRVMWILNFVGKKKF